MTVEHAPACEKRELVWVPARIAGSAARLGRCIGCNATVLERSNTEPIEPNESQWR